MKSCWGGCAPPDPPLAFTCLCILTGSSSSFLHVSILNEILLGGLRPPRPPACIHMFMHTHWQLIFIFTFQHSKWNLAGGPAPLQTPRLHSHVYAYSLAVHLHFYISAQISRSGMPHFDCDPAIILYRHILLCKARNICYLMLSWIGSLGTWKEWKTNHVDSLWTWKYWNTNHFHNVWGWKWWNLEILESQWFW